MAGTAAASSSSRAIDTEYMRSALGEARSAALAGEVPVGALLVVKGRVVATGANRTVGDTDPSAHAEIVVLRSAAASLGNHRTGGTLYVTLEPCIMCMGALVQARIERLVYGALDAKAGAAVSLYRLAEDERLNHRFTVEGGVLAEESARLLGEFFAERRGRG